MNDIQKMQGTLLPMETEENTAILKGKAPVSTMRDYQKEVVSYTRGMGRLFCSLKGYEPCKNQDEIVEQIGYDSERDLDNPTGSVFCAHGAGFVVPWYEVEAYMHMDTGIMAEFEDDLSEEDWRMLRQVLEILQVETILLKVPEIQHAVELAVQELPEIHLEVEAVREVVTSRRNLPTVEAMRMTKNFRPFLSVPLVR